MTDKRVLYELVGRCAVGNDTKYYILKSENGKEVRYNSTQMAFVVGRGRVTNATAQVYQGKVLFRGIGCDIKSLPTIQLGNGADTTRSKSNKHTVSNSNKRTGSKSTKSVGSKVYTDDAYSTVIHIINNTIDTMLSSVYELVENFTIDKKIEDNKLYINVIENMSCCSRDNSETCYCILGKDGYICITHDNIVMYKGVVSDMDTLIKFLVSCMRIVRRDIRNCITKAGDFVSLIFDSFLYYSGYNGASYIDDVLRRAKLQHSNDASEYRSMLSACLMCTAYDSKKDIETYDGYLFKGESEFIAKSYVEHGFTSITYSIDVARNLLGTREGSRILAFKNLNLSSLIEMGEVEELIANGEPPKYEILLRPEVRIDVHEQIGMYKGVPICLATAESACSKMETVNHMVDVFVETYNTDLMYGVGYILKNMHKISAINWSLRYSDDISVTTLKGNNFKINGETDRFVMNDCVVAGRESITNVIELALEGKEECINLDESGVVYGAGKHKLSKETLLSIKDSIQIFYPHSTYEDMVNLILERYSSIAYNMEETILMKDMAKDGSISFYIHLVCVRDKICYIEVDIWDSDDKCKLAVSETTLSLIKYEYPYIVIDSISTDVNLSEYKYCHYHELAIRIGAFSRIPQFKRLKLKFMKYNTEIFDDKIPHDMVMEVGEYKDDTLFDDLIGLIGYSRNKRKSSNGLPMIIVSYNCFNSVNNIDSLSRKDSNSLLHEMTHAYVDAVYGSNREDDPSCAGDKLYGMDRDLYMVQCDLHGKKFGTAIQMVSDKTGLSFDELFGYGVRISSVTRETEYIKNLIDYKEDRSVVSKSDEAYTNENYIVHYKGYEHKTWDYKKQFEDMKNKLIEGQSKFEKFFMKNFNMKIKFNITEDDTKLVTTDNFGCNRMYDISYYKGVKGYVCLYRVYNNTPALLYRDDFRTDDGGVIKRLLRKVYIDTITD